MRGKRGHPGVRQSADWLAMTALLLLLIETDHLNFHYRGFSGSCQDAAGRSHSLRRSFILIPALDLLSVIQYDRKGDF